MNVSHDWFVELMLFSCYICLSKIVVLCVINLYCEHLIMPSEKGNALPSFSVSTLNLMTIDF
jgi:hypothetical protein